MPGVFLQSGMVLVSVSVSVLGDHARCCPVYNRVEMAHLGMSHAQSDRSGRQWRAAVLCQFVGFNLAGSACSFFRCPCRCLMLVSHTCKRATQALGAYVVLMTQSECLDQYIVLMETV